MPEREGMPERYTELLMTIIESQGEARTHN